MNESTTGTATTTTTAGITTVSTTTAGTTTTTRRLRYPGAPPFGDSPLDEVLFFGREVEAEEALHSILSHELFVLYARSGVGKTSLLKARVVNRLRERDLWPVFVRMADASTSPTELVRQALADENGRNSIEVVGADDQGLDLFELLRSVRIWKDDILQMPVLVFDQSSSATEL